MRGVNLGKLGDLTHVKMPVALRVGVTETDLHERSDRLQCCAAAHFIACARQMRVLSFRSAKERSDLNAVATEGGCQEA